MGYKLILGPSSLTELRLNALHVTCAVTAAREVVVGHTSIAAIAVVVVVEHTVVLCGWGYL